MVGSQITKRLKRIQQLVNLVQKLRRAVGVYHAPNIETLVGKLEAGVTELTRLSEEMILAESEEDCDDEPQEEWSGESYIPHCILGSGASKYEGSIKT